MYAKVIVGIGVKNVDKMFTYIVPDELKNKIKIGTRVKVPFGHQTLEGFVLEITDRVEETYELKTMLELIDEEPILNDEMLSLGKNMADNLLCSLISAYQVMLPKALKASYKTDMKIKLDKYITINKTKEEIKEYIKKSKYSKQKEILNTLLTTEEILINKQDSAMAPI